MVYLILSGWVSESPQSWSANCVVPMDSVSEAFSLTDGEALVQTHRVIVLNEEWSYKTGQLPSDGVFLEQTECVCVWESSHDGG